MNREPRDDEASARWLQFTDGSMCYGPIYRWTPDPPTAEVFYRANEGLAAEYAAAAVARHTSHARAWLEMLEQLG